MTIFACHVLALWSQTELGRCMSPLLYLLCTLAGWRTSSGECHCFRVTWMATPPLPFRISTQLDRSRPTNSGVQTVKALHHAGVAMFMRSTRGCGILDGLSLELEDFRSLKRKRSAGRPGRTLPGARGRAGGPVSVLLRRYDVDKHGINLLYTWYILSIYKV